MVRNRVQHKKPIIRALNALPGETLVEDIARYLPSGGLFASALLKRVQQFMSASKLNIGFKKYICTNCKYIGSAARETKGSFVIEVLLWLFFIFPGLLYSIWRLTGRKLICPQCEQHSLIPVNTPMGEKLSTELKK